MDDLTDCADLEAVWLWNLRGKSEQMHESRGQYLRMAAAANYCSVNRRSFNKTVQFSQLSGCFFV